MGNQKEVIEQINTKASDIKTKIGDFIESKLDDRWNNKLYPAYQEGVNFVINEIMPHRDLTKSEENRLKAFFNNKANVDRFKDKSLPLWARLLGGGYNNGTTPDSKIYFNPLQSASTLTSTAVHEGVHKVQVNPLKNDVVVSDNRVKAQQKALPTSISIVPAVDTDYERDATIQELLFNISKKNNGVVGDELTQAIQDMPLWKLNWLLANVNPYGFNYWLSNIKNRLTSEDTRQEQGEALKQALYMRKSGGKLNYAKLMG